MISVDAATLLRSGEASSFPEGDTTLVIVDMQYDFVCSREAWLLKAVERLILHAMSKGWRIVILEWGPKCGERHTPTYSVLTDHLTDYSRKQVKRKWDNDGAPEVQEVHESDGFVPKRFVVCGVNSSKCVRATTKGLNGRFPQARIDVVKDTCNDDDAGQAYDWEEHFYKDDNVNVVELESVLV